jgi:hypothetical protein
MICALSCLAAQVFLTPLAFVEHTSSWSYIDHHETDFSKKKKKNHGIKLQNSL